jgi:sulfate adenylyltransferase subunit 1 (EFTu-like GTPase family)
MFNSIIQNYKWVLCFSLLTLIYSCKKSDDNAETASFKFTYQGVTTTSAYHKAFTGSMASTPILIGSNNPNLRPSPKTVSITLPSFNTGTYNVTATGAHTLYFVDDAGDVHVSVNGTVTISSYANNKISGQFSVFINHLSGTSQPLSGSFTNTPVEP